LLEIVLGMLGDVKGDTQCAAVGEYEGLIVRGNDG
jgi:hypothetical protein